jgi:hypothetical protein
MHMSNTLAFNPPSAAVGTKPRAGIWAAFKAVIESLVTSQARLYEQTGNLGHRFPPF